MRRVSSIPTARRAMLLALFCLVASCFSPLFNDPGPDQLRIRNVGSAPLVGLKVGFPDTTIAFGDIPAGAATEYTDVPGGVYSYSAFRFQYQGSERVQPVIDFVGELPMQGRRFTYEIELIEGSGQPFVVIKAVTKDR